MKRCSKCKTFKPLDEFHRKASLPDGHVRWCKACCRAAKVSWYYRNQQKAIAQACRWIEEHRERFNGTARKNWPRAYDRQREVRVAAQQRRNRELSPGYLRGRAKQLGVSEADLQRVARRIRLHRTKPLFKLLATASAIKK